jgi:hypothetical protein
MRWFKHSTRIGCLTLVVSFALLGGSRAEDLSDDQILTILENEQPRDAGIRKGLQYLRRRQRSDGSVGDHARTAVTSLAVMAHLAAGHTIDDPEVGPFLRRAIRFVLLNQDRSGYLGQRDGSRMYGHGIATLMLAEALGETRDDALEEPIRNALERAIRVTVAAARVQKDDQNRGGWRYEPHDSKSDLSLSGWQLMSLHATQQVGISVPEETIDAAVEYARRLIDRDGRVGYEHRGQDHVALRGLALLCLAIDKEGGRMMAEPIEWRGAWFFYRAYYDAVGLSRAKPEAWRTYGPHLDKILLDHQASDGSWMTPPADNERGHGSEYCTSMALLALAVDRHVLPAYQR